MKENMSLQSFFNAIEYALHKTRSAIFLKPKQVICIEGVYLGRDVLAVLPTGYGKSVIFHLLPFILSYKYQKRFGDVDGVGHGRHDLIIVVSPLNSIIQDQVSKLREKGVSSVTLSVTGTATCRINFKGNIKNKRKDEEDDEDDDNDDDADLIIQNGKDLDKSICSFLFAHPEAIVSQSGRKFLKSQLIQKRVGACVIDEAHCIKEWGTDFRPDYGRLAVLTSLFPSVPILALTATAPLQYQIHIIKSLSMHNVLKVVGNPDRANIVYKKVTRKGNLYGNEGYNDILLPLAHRLLCERVEFPITIIYMPLKWCGYAYCLFSEILGVKQYHPTNVRTPANRLFAQYHSPQTEEMKASILEQLTSNQSTVRVLFATIAVGLGVDAPHVRYVINIGLPKTLEEYFQEIGRAGRDGKPAIAILYWNNNDIASNSGVSNEMIEFCKNNSTCLRTHMLNYLGHTSALHVQSVKHNCCSNCEKICNCLLCCSDCNMNDMSLDDINELMPLQECVRHVTMLQRASIEQELLKYRLQLGSQKRRFGSISIGTGFTLKLVTSVVNNCEYLFTVSDVKNCCQIWDDSHAKIILNVIENFSA